MIGAAITVFLTNNRAGRKKKLDERYSFHRREKIPYGLHVAFAGLGAIFPDATITTSRKEPGFWETISSEDVGQALIIISPEFNADEYEMKELIRFVESGNKR